MSIQLPDELIKQAARFGIDPVLLATRELQRAAAEMTRVERVMFLPTAEVTK